MLIVEPIAADYTLLPGETVELEMDEQPPNAYIHIDYEERRIMIWEEEVNPGSWGSVGWVVAKKGNVELECGYQREEWERYHREHNLPYPR
jgi:hypothetical protein